MNKALLSSLFCIVFLIAKGQPGPNDGVSFNGIDQFILIPDSDNINTTPVDNRTIETYFKVDDATSRQVFYKEGAEVNTIKFYVENGNLIVGSYRNNGGTNRSIWFRTAISDDTWYHVALVLDDASRLRFYLNGVLQAENTNYFQLPVHPGNFEIARTQGPARYPDCNSWGMNGNVEECLGDVSPNDNTVLYFGGSIYGFRIWDDVRTVQEINDNKDLLITDPSSPAGSGLLAFLNGSSMSYQDDNGDFDTAEATGGVLGLDEIAQNLLQVVDEDNQLRVIMPNFEAPEEMILFDLLGKKVAQVKQAKTISKTGLRSGIYILKIINEAKVYNKKILISN